MDRRTVILAEQQFEYDHGEYLGWGAADGRVVDDALRITGDLGKSAGSITNQARSAASGRSTGNQHYPEVCYARHLIRGGEFPRDGLVYENFRVSARERARAKDPTKLVAAGTRRVAEIFTDEFFTRFDALCDRNRNVHGAGVIEGARLDLFAVDRVRRRAGFWEIKKYGLSGNRTEAVQVRQLLMLAFIQHLVMEERDRVLRDSEYVVEVALVAFVPRGRSMVQRQHTVVFDVV